jgi:hypothetical protein
MGTAVPAYLVRPDIHPHFNLLGDGPRFLQGIPPVPDFGEPYILSKIAFHLSSGNNPKLFDHWGNDAREWDPGYMAIALLCLQNFFVGGSMASKVKGNGPALKSLQMLLSSRDLHSTILMNCLDLETVESTGGGLGQAGLGKPAG